jgi:hypothetical protein
MLFFNEDGKRVFVCYFISCENSSVSIQSASDPFSAAEQAMRDYFGEDTDLEDERFEELDVSSAICVVDLFSIRIGKNTPQDSICVFDTAKIAQDAGLYEASKNLTETLGEEH